jgi:hypothetical protein
MARNRSSQVHGGGPLTRSRDKVLRMLGESPFKVPEIERDLINRQPESPCTGACTDKKENQIYFIYKEIQSGAVAK